MSWTQECEASFQKLKKALVYKPVLGVADPTKPFILHADSSNHGLGTVLSQTGEDGHEHPVAFASGKLLPWDIRNATIEKECLAVVWALRKFHV